MAETSLPFTRGVPPWRCRARLGGSGPSAEPGRGSGTPPPRSRHPSVGPGRAAGPLPHTHTPHRGRGTHRPTPRCCGARLGVATEQGGELPARSHVPGLGAVLLSAGPRDSLGAAAFGAVRATKPTLVARQSAEGGSGVLAVRMEPRLRALGVSSLTPERACSPQRDFSCGGLVPWPEMAGACR